MNSNLRQLEPDVFVQQRLEPGALEQTTNPLANTAVLILLKPQLIVQVKLVF
jgi:hypothetical protein